MIFLIHRRPSPTRRNVEVMPTTFASALVLTIAVFPGMLGDRIYRSVIGVDWRQKLWEGVARTIGFSVVGLTIYSLLADVAGWPPPLHVMPAVYTKLGPDNATLNKLFLTYVGHLGGGIAAGALGAAGARLLAALSAQPAHPGAWDEFIRRCVPGRWIVVRLRTGDTYAGRLRYADCSVASGERDIILDEPAVFDENARDYRTSTYQSLFIAAGDVFSIASVTLPGVDARVVAPGELLFTEERNEPESEAGRARRVSARAADEPAGGPAAPASPGPAARKPGERRRKR